MNLTARVKSLFKSKHGPQRLAMPAEAARRVHANVKSIVERLGAENYHTLVVGGAVRDLLLGRSPRDFDLASDARPEQVKRLFSNARIIGRRFRLVHLTYPDMTVELSTFRAAAPPARDGMIMRDNTYGTPEQDAFRRDFTVNALAYDIVQNEVIDFVGGLDDLEARTIRTITAPHVSLREDPVRMLRVVRFMVGLDFTVEPGLERVMRRMAPHLLKVKRHRLAEETQRFLTRGSAVAIHEQLEAFGLLLPLLGLDGFKWFFDDDALLAPLPRLIPYLEALDAWARAGRETPSATVAWLGLLIALARPELRTGLELARQMPPKRTRQNPGRKESYPLRNLRKDLRPMLGNWGLLSGQVEPALQILEAMRLLLKHRPGQGQKWSQKQGHAPNRNPAGGAPPPGAREAWQVLALLQDVLELPANTPQTALREMAALPVLPIFDHMPRGKGRRGYRRPRIAPPKAGSTKGGATSENQSAPAPAARRRRFRRGRSRDRAQL